MEAQLVGKMRSHVTLMTEGRPVRLIVMFALPLMLGNMFQELYSVVDSMIVGRNLGVSALAALGVTSWPIWIMVGMLMGLAQGISILLARLFGQGNECELKRGFGNAIILSAVFAAVLLLVVSCMQEPFLIFLILRMSLFHILLHIFGSQFQVFLLSWPTICCHPRCALLVTAGRLFTP